MISAEDFVRIWQASSSQGEVQRASGLSPSRVSQRASQLRARGVPLKKFAPRASVLDSAALAACAASTEEPPMLLHINRMARHIRVPARWLRAEAKEGRIPHLRAGSQLLFNRVAVERILAERAACMPGVHAEAGREALK